MKFFSTFWEHNHLTDFAKLLDKRNLLIISSISILLILASHLFTLTKYPAVFIDESWTANIAWTYLTKGANFDSINTGSIDQFGYPWLIYPFLGTLPFTISIQLLGLGLLQIRLVSLLFSIILLLMVVSVGRMSYSLPTGILAALLLSLSGPFLFSSHLARQDIILAAMVMVAYALVLLALRDDKWWAHLLAGVVLGFSIDIHENAVFFIPGVAAIYLVTYRSKLLRKSGTWLIALGGLLGIAYYLAYHILPNPDAYFKLNSYFYEGIHQAPWQSLSLSTLLTSLRYSVGMYHFYDNTLEFALIGASIIYLTFRQQLYDRLLLIFTGTAFAFFVLFQGYKPDFYAILFYPFLMLMIAETFISFFQITKQVGTFKVFWISVIILYIFNSTIHIAKPVIQNRDYDFGPVISEMQEVLPADARVMGSPTWWLGLSEYDYHSYTNLQYNHFFKGYSLTQGLDHIQPDILIVDDFMRWHLFDGTSMPALHPEPTFPVEEFDAFLARYGTKLLEFTDPWHGLIQIYSINWIDYSEQ
jgi:4-amino-4-deoxy-L-arabinose transferase-like glycosyltransferase